MTRLQLANVLLFQWFGIRLARIVDITTRRTTGYQVMFWIIPLTGWWNDFHYIGAPKRSRAVMTNSDRNG